MTGSWDPVRQAVFLVGGKGTRLGDIAGAIPKPMVEVAPGLPFLDVLLDNAARQGFTKLLLLAGHLGEQVEARYNGRQVRGAEVTVLCEPDTAGTGGALVHAHEALDSWFIRRAYAVDEQRQRPRGPYQSRESK